jgi:hypothetical protein
MNIAFLPLITRLLSLSVMAIVAIVLSISSNVALSFSNGQSASYVLGQPDFKSNDKFAVSLAAGPRSLHSPVDLAID